MLQCFSAAARCLLPALQRHWCPAAGALQASCCLRAATQAILTRLLSARAAFLCPASVQEGRRAAAIWTCHPWRMTKQWRAACSSEYFSFHLKHSRKLSVCFDMLPMETKLLPAACSSERWREREQRMRSAQQLGVLKHLQLRSSIRLLLPCAPTSVVCREGQAGPAPPPLEDEASACCAWVGRHTAGLGRAGRACWGHSRPGRAGRVLRQQACGWHHGPHVMPVHASPAKLPTVRGRTQAAQHTAV